MLLEHLVDHPIGNHHGDRKSPKDWGCGTFSKWLFHAFFQWGVTKYLLG